MVKVWGIGHAGPNLAHSVELLDIALMLDVDDILIGKRIPKEWREYLTDIVLLIGDKTFFVELDRATEDMDQIAARAKKLLNCPFPVLWACPDGERMDELIGAAVNEQHWFTTMSQLAAQPHGPVWENSAGQLAAIPERLDVQSDVQFGVTVAPMGSETN